MYLAVVVEFEGVHLGDLRGDPPGLVDHLIEYIVV